MAKRVDTSTKTTRNKEFNSYMDLNTNVYHTVLSTTAGKKDATTGETIRNIKLHDVGEAIIKKGYEIADDALNNTAMIETMFGFDNKTAKVLANYAINGRPDPVQDPSGAKAYDRLETILESYGSSFQKVYNMVIDYYYDAEKNPDGIFNNETKDNPYYIFGAPEQAVLNNRQHYNNCGIESTLNTLAMAGYIKMNENLKDQKSVENKFLKAAWERNLAGDDGELGVIDVSDGGTLPDDYRDIMAYYGISSKSYYITDKADSYVYAKANLNEFAYKISQGYGAVVGVSANVLWNDLQSESGGIRIDHAITVLGVVYDTATPYDAEHGTYETPIGFYIQDTGAWMTRFISYDDFIEATLCNYTYGDPEFEDKLDTLKEWDSRRNTYITKDTEGIFVTLTDAPIKNAMFDLNATGDKYANTIWGNSGDNVIKGMKGNDTLYGGAGNDTIYGGVGDDTVVGNRVYNINATVNGYPFEFDSIDDFATYLKKAGAMSDKVGDPLKQRLDKIERQTITGDYTDITALFDAVQANLPNGVNTLYGDAGNDIIIGGEEADLIYGGKGNDYVYAGDGRNAVYAGAGNDVLVGGYDNDRLFGDAGNDYIFGLEDDDTIDGGAGNDHIYGGSGSDRIETGKGNDTIYFEGLNFGADEISSKGGNTVFKFIEDEDHFKTRVTDLFFSLNKDDEKQNLMNLKMAFKQADIKDDDSSITFDAFYNSKSKKAKALVLNDEFGEYKFTVSSKSKVTASSTVNNVVLSTSTNSTEFVTSEKNDVVTMLNSDDEFDTAYNDTKIVDTIKYTGGRDKYVSEEKNTSYYVEDFKTSTNLSIYDNVEGLTRWTDYKQYMSDLETKGAAYVAAHMDEYRTENGVSENDNLFINIAKSNLHFFFDVAAEDKDTVTDGLYVLDSTGAKYTSIATGEDVSGFVYMDSFFGNGEIENWYCPKEGGGYDKYTTIEADLLNISSHVAAWLGDYNTAHAGFECDSVFGALQQGVTESEMTALVTAYGNTAALT